MTTQLSENSQWYRGKTQTISKYQAEARGLMSNVAGRGFTFLPGFVYEGQTGLEIAAKMQLSDINYNILKETVDRELKQAGLDYDIAYRDARRQWEIEKQALLDAWEREFAGIKMGMSLSEEVLEQFAIEVSKRGTALIIAKTAIDVQMEAYKKEIVELDDDTAALEVSLAEQKLATAQKKLEIIPILEQILDKESELLESESNKADAYTALIEAEQAISTKKENELLPVVANYASVAEQLADEIPRQTAIEIDIEEQKIELAELEVDKSAKERTLLEKEIEIQTVNANRVQAAISLDTTKSTNQIALMNLDVANSRTAKDARVAADAEILAKETDTASILNTDRTQDATVKIDEKLDSADRLYPSEIDKIARMADLDAAERKNTAEISAAAKITSELIHLLEN